MTKICTNLQQSKKLIELGLDVNTADMCWSLFNPDLETLLAFPFIDANNEMNDKVPAWSLSALLDLLPYEIAIENDANPYRLSVTHKLVQYPRLTTMWPSLYSVEANTTFDAVFEMVCQLIEDKKI